VAAANMVNIPLSRQRCIFFTLSKILTIVVWRWCR